MILIRTVLPRLRCLLTTGLAALALLTSVQQVHADTNYQGGWSGIYPGSASDGSGCQLCHGSSTQNINPYGFAIASCNPATSGSLESRIAAAGVPDSDGQGDSNLTEINADSQPGWTTGQNALWGRNNCNPNGTQAAPSNACLLYTSDAADDYLTV